MNYEPKLKGEPVSEIKVGDKVRVVQIIVKEYGLEGFRSDRVEYLGCEGKVTNTTPLGLERVIVSLPRFSGSVVAFHADELKVLSAPCEQPESKDAVTCLREELFRLNDMNREMLATNDRLRKRIEELKRLNKSVHAGNVNAREANEKLLGTNMRLREERERLQRSHTDLQKQYEELIRTSATMRVDIRNILNATQRT